MDSRLALLVLDGYLEETARVNLRRLDGPSHDEANVLRTLRALSHLRGQPCPRERGPQTP